MTDTPVLVWDASALHHAAVADRVDVLAHLARPWRNVTTAAVLEELGTHGLRNSVLGPDWLEDHRLDGLGALPLLLQWTDRLGAGQHHRGEVTVASGREQSPAGLAGFFGALIGAGARLPFATGTEWSSWARDNGLL